MLHITVLCKNTETVALQATREIHGTAKSQRFKPCAPDLTSIHLLERLDF